MTHWKHLLRVREFSVAVCSGSAVHYTHGRNDTRRSHGVCAAQRKKFYLVHNVRRGEKVKQIHLARLGERAQITDRVVREVSKKHPFVELNWRALREQVNGQQVDLADANSPVCRSWWGTCEI